jgi:hypothetical protein
VFVRGANVHRSSKCDAPCSMPTRCLAWLFNLRVIQIQRAAAIATSISTNPTLENLTRLPILCPATLYIGCRLRALIVV